MLKTAREKFMLARACARLPTWPRGAWNHGDDGVPLTPVDDDAEG